MEKNATCMRPIAIGLICLAMLLFGMSAQALTYTSSWIGSQFCGANGKWVQHHANGMYTTPDGYCFCHTGWDEGSRQGGVYKDGDVMSLNTDLSRTGCFGPCIAGDGTYVYIGGTIDWGNWSLYGSGVARFTPAGYASFTGGVGERGNSFTVSTSSSAKRPTAVAASAYTHKLYVADPNTNTIKVFNTASPTGIASSSWSISGFTIPNQVGEGTPPVFFMVANPYADQLWISMNHQIYCYNSSGEYQNKSITDMVNPGPMCFNNSGQLMVWEEGPNQNIRIYNVTGTPTLASTFGTAGGIYSGERGVLAADKLMPGCYGLGVDSADNIYVVSNGWIGAPGTDLRKYTSSGTLVWMLNGLEFCDTASVDPTTDGADVYTLEEHFKMDYTKPAGQEWSYYGFSTDGFTYPDNKWHGDGVGIIRVLQGKRVMYQAGMYGGGAAGGGFDIYVFENGDGEIAAPAGHVPTGWVDNNGNIWAVGNGVINEYAFQGFDFDDKPIYTLAGSTTLPNVGWTEVDRTMYDEATDTMYLCGYTSSYPKADSSMWGLAGSVVYRYDNWNTSPSLHSGYPIQLPNDPSTANPQRVIKAITMAGDYIFAEEMLHQVVYVYSKSTGAELGTMVPGWTQSANVWVDIYYGIQAFKRSNGEYLIFVEENNHGATLMYRWNPSDTNKVAIPLFSPQAFSTSTYYSTQSVAISCTTSGATIRYTTDGTTPTKTVGTVYTAPVTISNTTTLKAIAYLDDYTDSDVNTGLYTISTTAATPTFNQATGTYYGSMTVKIKSDTKAATIRYTTDGSDPTSASTVYTGPLTLSSSCTLKAAAFLSGVTTSAVGSRTFTILPIVAGTIYGSPAVSSGTVNLTNEGTSDWAHWGYGSATGFDHKSTGGSQISNVTAIGNCPTYSNFSDNTVSFTWTDGAPNASVTATGTEIYCKHPIGNGFQFTVPADTTTRTLKIYVAAWYGSGTLTATMSDGSGTYTDSSVSDTTHTGYNAVYTLVYAAAHADQTLTVTWVVKDYTASAGNIVLRAATLASGADQCAAPTFSPAAGTYTSAQTVTISTTTSGASIRYTTDGSTPTSTTGTLYSGPVNISIGCTLKAIAYKSGMTNSSVTSGLYSISSGGSGLLSGNQSTPSGTINLTTQGTSDWAHWGHSSSTSFDHKSSGGTQISNFTRVGSASPLRYTDCAVGYTWTDGTPTTSATATTTGVYINQPSGNGFSFTVPADTTPRTLKVYCGIWHSAGTLTATLSDGSATSYTNTLSALDSVANAEYTINYAAGSAGQTLTVTWLCAYNYGNVTLQAATLANDPVSAPTFSPVAGTYTSAQSVTISTATSGASIRYTTDGSTPTSTTGTLYSGPVSISNTCTLKAIAYKSGMINSSVTSGGYTIIGDGSISGSVGTPSGTINLTTQGTSDWAHWGYSSSTSFDHKSSGGTQISNFTRIGSVSPVRYTDCAVGYTWTDGTPTTSATATTTGVYINQPSGNGFSFTVPADTNPRTVKVYCGIWHSAGTLTATLSDGSATSYTNTLSALNSVTNAEYTINYTAGSAGQTLTITWLCANNSGNVTLQAATLTEGGS